MFRIGYRDNQLCEIRKYGNGGKVYPKMPSKKLLVHRRPADNNGMHRAAPLHINASDLPKDKNISSLDALAVIDLLTE